MVFVYLLFTSCIAEWETRTKRNGDPVFLRRTGLKVRTIEFRLEMNTYLDWEDVYTGKHIRQLETLGCKKNLNVEDPI